MVQSAKRGPIFTLDIGQGIRLADPPWRETIPTGSSEIHVRNIVVGRCVALIHRQFSKRDSSLDGRITAIPLSLLSTRR